MNTFYIKLSTIEDIRKFVDIVTRQDYDIDLSSGRYVVDAKSIMGIFSLDLMNKILLTAHTDDVEDLKKALAAYIVEYATVFLTTRVHPTQDQYFCLGTPKTGCLTILGVSWRRTETSIYPRSARAMRRGRCRRCFPIG